MWNFTNERRGFEWKLCVSMWANCGEWLFVGLRNMFWPPSKDYSSRICFSLLFRPYSQNRQKWNFAGKPVWIEYVYTNMYKHLYMRGILFQPRDIIWVWNGVPQRLCSVHFSTRHFWEVNKCVRFLVDWCKLFIQDGSRWTSCLLAGLPLQCLVES